MRNIEGEFFMENERILRTSVFGGFKKDDVLQYVEELKKEISALNEEIKEKAEKLSDLTGKVDELSVACDAAKTTEEKLSKVQEENSALQAENENLRKENLAFAKRMATLDEEEKAIEMKAEQVRLSESQLGAAFLDARKYSDEIVTAANRKATDTQNDASDSIEAQAAEIAKLSTDVDTLSDTLTKSVAALHADITALSLKLTKAAQSLKNRKDAEKFVPDISIKIEELDEKLADVNDAKDANGLTFIHYPSSSDHTNLQTDSVYRFDKTKEG